MLNIILGLINKRNDKPIQVIPGYHNKKQPPKPYGCAYIINHTAHDEYSNISETKQSDDIIEMMRYVGEFEIQFDVFGKTEEETFEKARALRELITYKMRYQDWIPNNVGITNSDYSMRALHEKADTGEYIYRYSFDITFESALTMERLTTLAKTIDLKLNDSNIKIGGK